MLEFLIEAALICAAYVLVAVAVLAGLSYGIFRSYRHFRPRSTTARTGSLVETKG